MWAGPLAAQQIYVRGFERYAIIAHAADEAVARPFAEQHCGRYGRLAIFSHTDGPYIVFHCMIDGSEPPPEIRLYIGRGIY